MPIKLTDLIARVPREVEARVRRARDQAQPVVREALRAECRLMFRTAEETEQKRSGAQVPIEVAPGYPLILEGVAFPDDFERIMLLTRYRSSLEQARDGASKLQNLHDALLRLPDPDKWTSARASDLQSVASWAAALIQVLDKYDPLQKVLSVSQDFIGIYEYLSLIHI